MDGDLIVHRCRYRHHRDFQSEFLMRHLLALICLTCLVFSVPAHAAQVLIAYSAAYDEIRPSPRPIRINANFDVALGEGGAVSENINRSSQRASDNFKKGMKLGSGWSVLGPNRLQRIIDQPQSRLMLVVTTSGSSCDVDVSWTLKPGFSEFKFKKISDGTWGFYTQPQIVSKTCTIK